MEYSSRKSPDFLKIQQQQKLHDSAPKSPPQEKFKAFAATEGFMILQQRPIA